MKNEKMDNNEALDLLMDEDFEKIYKKKEDKYYTRKDLYELLKKELDEKEKLERTNTKKLCSNCISSMYLDDSDEEMIWFKLYQIPKKITNWWVCPKCGMTCIVEKKYTYLDADGNEIKGEED